MQKKISWSPESAIHDLFVLTGLYCFLTGFLPLAPQAFYEAAASKPIIHRSMITIFTMSAAAWAWARHKLAPKAGLSDTPLILFLKSRPLSIFQQVIVLFLFSASLWSYAAIARHQAFQSGFDMAIFTQAVWNTANGSFMYSSIKGGINLMGDHFSPLLAIFAVPYRLWPHPECLLALQAALAASSIFPLFLLAKNKTNNAWALVVVFSFLCYLPLRNSVRFEFHPEVAALPLFFWAYYFWDRSRLLLCSAFLLLALLSKESAAIVTFGFGFFALFSRRYLFALAWMFFSAVYFYLAIKVWIPGFSGQDYFYLSGNFLAWKQAGPIALLKQLASKASLGYLIKIFLPVGFLPFASGSVLLALPGLLQNLTSRNEMTLSIFHQYTAILTPFVFISTAEALKRFHPKKTGVLVYLAASAILMAGVSDFYIAAVYKKQATAHLKKIPAYFSKVPAEASVRTHEFFAAHFAHRREVHIYENHHPREGGSEKAMNSDYVVLDRTFLGSQGPEQTVQQNYEEIFSQDGFMIFKRKDMR